MVRVSATTNAVLNRVTVDERVHSIAATEHVVWAVHVTDLSAHLPSDGVVTRIAYRASATDPGSAPRLTDRQGQLATASVIGTGTLIKRAGTLPLALATDRTEPPRCCGRL